MSLIVPELLVTNCGRSPERTEWLVQLPAVIGELERRWSLTLDPPFDGPEVSASWVAPVRRSDGSSAVMKLGMPHMEADHEIHGLRSWDGDPTVRLLDADEAIGAMLLERCEPGTALRSLPELEQDVVIAGLLRRLWRIPPAGHPFRPLADMVDLWVEETRGDEDRWPDPGLVRAGLQMFEELAHEPGRGDVLLATDLHAGNVLRAEREPWLVIDPKPFVGDPTYDATQHLLNCESRMRDAPLATISRFADLLDVDADRVRSWMFARTAAESRDDWGDPWMDVARALHVG